MEPDNQGLAAGLPQPSRLYERIIIAESLILAERSHKSADYICDGAGKRRIGFCRLPGLKTGIMTLRTTTCRRKPHGANGIHGVSSSEITGPPAYMFPYCSVLLKVSLFSMWAVSSILPFEKSSSTKPCGQYDFFPG